MAFFFFYQYEVNGTVADSMLVNTILMLVYVTKFFWWEAGYWNTMDIAHDRGSHMLYLLLFLHCLLLACPRATIRCDANICLNIWRFFYINKMNFAVFWGLIALIFYYDGLCIYQVCYGTLWANFILHP